MPIEWRLAANPQPWFRGALYQLLQNPIYLGKNRHRKMTYPGEHEAIVSREVCDEAQRLLADNSAREARKEGAKSPSLLAGCVVDDQGNRMIASRRR